MQLPSADIAALPGLAAAAAMKAGADQATLKLSRSAHHLAKETAMRVIGVVTLDGAALGNLENLDVVDGSINPRLLSGRTKVVVAVIARGHDVGEALGRVEP